MMADEEKWYGMRKPITNEEIARIVANRTLEPTEAVVRAPGVPAEWYRTPEPLLAPGGIAKGSGVAFVQSPYTSFYTTTWGMNPLADVYNGNYLNMYRNVPVVKAAIDKYAHYISASEIELECSKKNPYGEEICEYVKKWMYDSPTSFSEWIRSTVTDFLVFGFAVSEIVYEDYAEEETELTEEDIREYDFAHLGISPIRPLEKGKKIKIYKAKGKPVWLKTLDPRYFRVRRDALGNIYGGIMWVSTPPIAVTPEKMFIVRRNPPSWLYESAYGISLLMSLVKVQNYIWQIEDDMLVMSHACVKPPIIALGGKPEFPFSAQDLEQLNQVLESRGAGSDVVLRGDVTAVQLVMHGESIRSVLQYLEYLHSLRLYLLGVPPQIMGRPEGSSRTTAEVSLAEFAASIRAYRDTLGEAIRMQIFRYLLERAWEDDLKHIPGEWREIPSLVWSPFEEKNIMAETTRAIQLYTAQIISRDEARVTAGFEPLGGDAGKTFREAPQMRFTEDFQAGNTPDPRVVKLGEIDGIGVYIVNHAIVGRMDERWLKDIVAGHHWATGHENIQMKYIPEDEIWVSDAVTDLVERRAFIYHELIERDLMKNGMPYSQAHPIAEEYSQRLEKLLYIAKKEVAKERPFERSLKEKGGKMIDAIEKDLKRKAKEIMRRLGIDV